MSITNNTTGNSGPSVPLRSEVKPEDTWDLSTLFKDDGTIEDYIAALRIDPNNAHIRNNLELVRWAQGY
jgi:hypothetical protein